MQKAVLKLIVYILSHYNTFFVQDVKNVLQIHDLESGKFLQSVPLAIGDICGVHGRKKSNELFFKFSSLVNPGKFGVFFVFVLYLLSGIASCVGTVGTVL